VLLRAMMAADMNQECHENIQGEIHESCISDFVTR
jgi:hypothetical protein